MSQDTKEQILDTAERLFAEQGIDAVSLRTITSEAHVNLAAVHYHFGSKEALVREVFARRVGQLNRERLALLDEYEARAGDGPLPIEDVLRALIAPAIRLSRAPDRGQMFMRLCGRIYTENKSYMDSVFHELFQEMIARFGAAFRRALPELPEREIFWRAHFAVGSMVHTMQDAEKIKEISGGLCDPTDVDGVIERMVQFTAAGMQTPLLDYAREQEAATVGAEGGS